jgi:hypothetical protein
MSARVADVVDPVFVKALFETTSLPVPSSSPIPVIIMGSPVKVPPVVLQAPFSVLAPADASTAVLAAMLLLPFEVPG